MAGIVNSYETVMVLSTKLGEEGIASTVESSKRSSPPTVLSMLLTNGQKKTGVSDRKAD